VVCYLILVVLLGCGGEGGGNGGANGEVARGGQPVALDLTPQVSGVTTLLQAVSPVSEDVVWVSGHAGTYLRTLDGGENWLTGVMRGQEVLQFRDVEAFDDSTAYLMSAGTGDLSRIYRTDDAGESWTLQYKAGDPAAFLDCMAFWDRDRGLAYGDAVDEVPFILRTEDGGSTWSRVPEGVLPPALDGEGGFAASGTCLATGPEGRAWIATGNGGRARVLRTADWGQTWEVSNVPVVAGSGAGLTTVRMGPGNRVGMALGGIIGGDTLKTDNVALTEDGGATWNLTARPAMEGPVYGSALVPLSDEPTPGVIPVVVAVGPGGLDWSANLGRTWMQVDSLTYWAVGFAAPGAGWAVGPQGRVARLTLR
jgi:photosystem II stability/assembly factor-like uncharacterized protein